ncbi:hypothetical protein [Streptomyces sasae]|uniref:hypothetical protein n=1 Tax=Streptomyces sasae TaxID=1266772 RepID=UPI00292F9DB7|nr:hypothetical protein [Streptomyces sasae]
MSESVTVAAAMPIAKPRLRAWLRSPATAASTWAEHEWTGLHASWTGSGTRRRAEPAAAVQVCDEWINGDHARSLPALDEDGALALGFDEPTGSLTVDFDARVDIRLPGAVWAFTLLRGITAHMADDDIGLVTVTTDWSADLAPLCLAPNRSSFLDPGRDGPAWSNARDMEFDVRCAVSALAGAETAAQAIQRTME